MNAPAYQGRVVAEKRDLDARIAALAKFLEQPPALPEAELYRLDRQHLHMIAYSTVLAERIASF